MSEPKPSRILPTDLIKILGLGAAALAVSKGKKGLGNMIESMDQTSLEVLTEEAIDKHLGLTKDQVELTWAVRNHALDSQFYENHIEWREKRRMGDAEKEYGPHVKKTVVLGEVAVELTDNLMLYPLTLSTPLLSRLILNPIIGMSNEDLLESQKIINDLYLKGYEFATTDSYPGELYNDGTVKPDYVNENTISLIYGLRAFIYGMKVLDSHEANIQDVKQMSLLTGISFATSVWREIESEMSKARGNKGGDNGNFGQHYHEIKDIYEKIFTKKPLFTRFTDGFINFRNIVMTLNTWHTLAQTDTEGGKTDFIFYAGGGHGAVDEKFREGPKVLEKELQVYIDRVLGDTLTILTNAVEESKITDKNAVERLGGYFLMFPQSQTIGKDYQFKESDKDLKDTHSSLFQLWESIENKLDELKKLGIPKDNLSYKILKGAQFNLLRRFDFGSNILWYSQKRAEGKSAGSLFERIINSKTLGSKITWFEPQDYFLAQPDDLWSSKTDGRLLVGVAKVNGSIYPVIRKFGIQPGNESAGWQDQIQFPTGFVHAPDIFKAIPQSADNQKVGSLGNNMGFGVVLEVGPVNKRYPLDNNFLEAKIIPASQIEDEHLVVSSDRIYENNREDYMKMGFIVLKGANVKKIYPK